MIASADVAAPTDVFYVVQSTGVLGERTHRVRSALYATRAQAEVELARLGAASSGGKYSIWTTPTYVEPPDWLYDVVLSDGTVVRRPPADAKLPFVRWRTDLAGPKA